MAKTKSLYICQECGFQHHKWQGQCRGCNQWNTLVEETVAPAKSESGRGWSIKDSSGAKTVRLNEKVSEQKVERFNTSFNELNRVLGGGLVPGSYTLLGGDPGIGKSTLLLQMAGGLGDHGKSVLYVSGEESISQSALRAQRLGINSEKVSVAAESQLELILNLAKKHNPDVLIVDSIQTIYLSELTSAPGSVSQVRECASQLMSLAKGQNISIFIIGHVTKDGNIAGPKVLEHMVDTVLAFEGDGNHQFRLLRALKNRFGATNELGVFEMNSLGLVEVDNPSEMFLEERGKNLIGSSIYAAVEGSRPLLCEIQALVTPTPTSMPRRTSLGFDLNRVHLLVAVLTKHLKLEFNKSDIFINVVGGLKLSEPATDLAVAAALISSAFNIEINGQCCFFGEVGLTGEVRTASLVEERLKEAEKLGFKYFILPYSNKKHLKKLNVAKNAEVIYVKNIGELAKCIKNISQATKKPKKLPSNEPLMDL